MAYHAAAGVRTQAVPAAFQAGVVTTATFTHTVTANMANGDIVEIGMLPAGNKIVRASAKISGLSAAVTSVDIGLMSGAYGDKDNARTCGDEIVDGGAVNGSLVVLDPVAASAIAKSDKNRGIGVKVLGGAAAAADGGTITLVLEYAA